MDDKEIIEAVLGGKNEAFGIFVDRYSAQIYENDVCDVLVSKPRRSSEVVVVRYLRSSKCFEPMICSSMIFGVFDKSQRFSNLIPSTINNSMFCRFSMGFRFVILPKTESFFTRSQGNSVMAVSKSSCDLNLNTDSNTDCLSKSTVAFPKPKQTPISFRKRSH